jgi:hypothetical protein
MLKKKKKKKVKKLGVTAMPFPLLSILVQGRMETVRTISTTV